MLPITGLRISALSRPPAGHKPVEHHHHHHPICPTPLGTNLPSPSYPGPCSLLLPSTPKLSTQPINAPTEAYTGLVATVSTAELHPPHTNPLICIYQTYTLSALNSKPDMRTHGIVRLFQHLYSNLPFLPYFNAPKCLYFPSPRTRFLITNQIRHLKHTDNFPNPVKPLSFLAR